MYYIGIDLGTSAIKLLLMEGNGKICNICIKGVTALIPNRDGLSKIHMIGMIR